MEECIDSLQRVTEEDIDTGVSLRSLSSWVKTKKKIKTIVLPKVKMIENKCVEENRKVSCLTPSKKPVYHLRKTAVSPIGVPCKTRESSRIKIIGFLFRKKERVIDI